MATLNWPGFGLASISPTLDQPSQSNSSGWTGKRTVVANPWHGKWSFQVTLATRQGDAAFQTARAFFTSLKGQINTFHLPAVEAAQNANTGVTLSANAAQGATSLALTGVTTALVAGNMVTIAGQLLSLTTVGSLSAGAQTVNFQPALRAAASSGASVETAKPYALVYLSDSSFTWDIGSWRRYGLTFNATEAVSETDGADPALDVWTGGVGSGGGSGTSFSFPQLTSFISRSLLAAVVGPTNKQLAYLTEAGREGEFIFSTANHSAHVTADPQQGIYVAPSSDTTGASGAWVRADVSDTRPEWFGAVADGSTDDSAAILAALATLKALATSGYGYANLGAARLKLSAKVYYLGTTTMDLDFGIIIEGESVGGPGPGSSVLKWANGTTGIRTQYNDTTGATGTKASVANYGLAVLRNLLLYGSYTSGAESEAYGIHARASISVEDVGIFNFPGDGVYQRNTAGGSPEGNSNVSFFRRVFVQGCRSGFYVDGADVNASTFLACNASANRQWGFWDSSFIGNTYLGCHTAGNGWDGAISSTPTACTYSSKRYYVKPGQAVGASTNAPSGTTADNTWWGYIGAGGTYNGIVAWVSGTTFREGGSYKCDEASAVNQVISCYAETDQNPPQVATPSMVWGGVVGEINKGNCPTINASGADLVLSGGILTQGQIGSYGSSVGTDHAVYAVAGSGGQYRATNYHEFFASGVRAGYWGSGGLNLDSGKNITNNGVQVLGARITGWAAATNTKSKATFDSTTVTLAQLAARVGQLIDDLTTHGVIGA